MTREIKRSEVEYSNSGRCLECDQPVTVLHMKDGSTIRWGCRCSDGATNVSIIEERRRWQVRS